MELEEKMAEKKIPVILDTDIGGDIDDTWALAMLLNSPELDVRLIASCSGNTVYRAKLIAKLLEKAGRVDIPVGVGIKENRMETHEKGQGPWVADYDLGKYPGRVYDDAVKAMSEIILSSREPVTIISIGPSTNLAALLDGNKNIAPMCRYVGMLGSIKRGNFVINDCSGGKAPKKEYNVICDIPAAQKVLLAPWKSMVITPLDTCGWIRLTGEKYGKILASRLPLAMAVIENYKMWNSVDKRFNDSSESSVLFDTVAVHLAYSEKFLSMKEMGIRIADDGMMLEDPAANKMRVALEWSDLEGFEDYLVKRLLA